MFQDETHDPMGAAENKEKTAVVVRGRRSWLGESTRLSLGSPERRRISPQHLQTWHTASTLQGQLGPYALSSTKFQTLFHPLIRVFFNFRASYLFAIGLPYIFSFGSIYPPAFTQACQPVLLGRHVPCDQSPDGKREGPAPPGLKGRETASV